MPCPSISVNYKLKEENFERAGYINYWDPHNLITGYAVSTEATPICCIVIN